jgi:hypothetical protein
MTDWNQTLAPDVPWETAYAVIEEAVKGFLDTRAADARDLGTTPLIYSICGPKALTATRKRFNQGLRALRTRGLADYVTIDHGPNPFKPGTTCSIYLWHAAQPPSLEERRDAIQLKIDLLQIEKDALK